MLRLFVVALFVSAVPCLVFGQAQVARPTDRSPELERLGYYVGIWTWEGDYLLEPKSKSEGTVTYEWFPGGLSVVGQWEGMGVRGPVNTLEILGYSAADRAYTGYTVTRLGPAQSIAKWAVDGNVWFQEVATTVGGKPAKARYTITEVSPTSWTFTAERSVDGGSWEQTSVRKVTKVK
jgi:hypothetical protein